jgi:hypothetical protein
MVCGSVGSPSTRLSGDVDERVKAFLGSAAPVYQQQAERRFGRHSSADRFWLATGPLLFPDATSAAF